MSAPSDVRLTGFGIRNFRSFDADGVMLPKLSKLNLVIGQNNCGKSNVIRFLRHMASHEPRSGFRWKAHDAHRGSDSRPSVVLDIETSSIFPQGAIVEALPTIRLGCDAQNGNHDGQNPFSSIDMSGFQHLRHYTTALEQLYSSRFSRRFTTRLDRESIEVEIAKYLALDAWREFLDLIGTVVVLPDFRKLSKDAPDNVTIDGGQLIDRLHSMQHPAAGKEIEQEQFLQLEAFLRELIGDVRIEIPETKDNIVLRMHGLRRNLSDFGSGLHELSIMCCALAMYNDRLFLIEEPEVHLHPSLQRRLAQFMVQRENQYIVTTHSNVLLDVVSDSSVYHVRYDGSRSSIEHVTTDSSVRMILDDLAYTASDILQSNGIVWVEGPSDRVYLQKWLDLAGSKHVDGVHFSIMFYGGTLLSHLSCSDGAADEFIQLLRINRNAFVVIDSDIRSSELARLRAYKTRIQDEIGEDRCWITDGKEVENYLTARTIEEWVKERTEIDVSLRLRKNQVLQTVLDKALQGHGRRIQYARTKVDCAREIVRHIGPSDLDTLDLRERIEALRDAITEWNVAIN